MVSSKRLSIEPRYRLAGFVPQRQDGRPLRLGHDGRNWTTAMPSLSLLRTDTLARHARRVHLHHVPARPALPAGPHGPRGHLALVLPGRQDRRHRAERGGQVEPAADHGRPRRRVHRRGAPHARASPSATCRQEPQLDPAKDVKGNVMDGVGEVQAPHRPVQRRDGEVVRARRRLRGHRRRAGDARGPDRRRRRVERRAQRRDRDGRAALPARRRRRHDALRRREAARRARAGSCSSTRTCCCSTSRPTTSTPSRSSGSSASSTSTRARSSPSPTTATSSTTSRSGSSSWTAAGASRSPATTRAGWSRSSSAWRSEQKQADARQRTLARELEWVRMGAEGPPVEGQGAPLRLRAAARRGAATRRRRARARDRDPARPAPGRPGDRGRGLRKGYGDRLLIEDLTFSLPRSGIVGIIGPNGAGKTTLFRMLVGPGGARRRLDRDRRHRRR